MAWIAPVIGLIGQASSATATAGATAQNQAYMTAEGGVASAQGFAEEAQERRSAGVALGAKEAAAAQSGGGGGGSMGRSIAQSARNMELDALNTRYKAQLQRWSYDTQSTNIGLAGAEEERSDTLGAGAALLKGFSTRYTANNLGVGQPSPGAGTADSGLGPG
jgi:hypothetical protein